MYQFTIHAYFVFILWSPYLPPYSVAHMACWVSIFKWGHMKLKFTDQLGKSISIFFLPWHGLQENLSPYLLIFMLIVSPFTVLPTNKALKGWQYFPSLAISSIYFWNKDEKHTNNYLYWQEMVNFLFLNSATGLRNH